MTITVDEMIEFLKENQKEDIRSHFMIYQAIIDHLQQTANNAELQRWGINWNNAGNFKVELMEDGYWTPWHLATRLQAPEVEKMPELDSLPMTEEVRKYLRNSEQHTNPSALASNIDKYVNNSGEAHENSFAFGMALLKQAAQALRQQPLNWSKYLANGGIVEDIAGSRVFKYDGDTVQVMDQSDKSWLHTRIYDEIFIQALIGENLKPYTPEPILQDGWYWTITGHYGEHVKSDNYKAIRKYYNGKFEITAREYEHESATITDRIIVLANPDTGHPWKITEPERPFQNHGGKGDE